MILEHFMGKKECGNFEELRKVLDIRFFAAAACNAAA